MAEYIDRVVLIETLKNCRDAHADVGDAEGCELIEDVMQEIIKQASADVAPVVRCEDCEYSYVGMSYLCCSHGVCVDCEIPPNFYCAEGKRKEPLTNDSRGGNNV